MNRYIIPQIKLGGPLHMAVVDHVVVDDTWLNTRAKLSSAIAYKGQGWGAYLHPILPYSDILRDQMMLLHARTNEAKDATPEGYFDEAELIKACGLSKDTLVNGMAKEIVGAQAWDMSKVLKRVSVDGVNKVVSLIDRAAWTRGIAEINSDGLDDYLTCASFGVDLGTATANYGGIINSDTAETTRVIFDKDQGTYTFILSNSTPSLGVPGAGQQIVSSYTADETILFRMRGTGKCTYTDLDIVSAGQAKNMFGVADIGNTCDKEISRCILNHNGSTGGDGISFRSSTGNARIFLNKVYGVASASFYGIKNYNATNDDGVVENNSVYVGSYGIAPWQNAGWLCRNNVAITTGGNIAWRFLAGITGLYNYSSGTTGEDADFTGAGTAGNVANGTTGGWVSVNPAESTFLAPVEDGALKMATTPTLWTTDIAGNPDTGYAGAQQVGVAAGFWKTGAFKRSVFKSGAWK